MKTWKVIVPMILCTGIWTSASANWFHNPRTNTNLNIGSAPNPTPEDLRAIRTRLATRGPYDLRDMLGKPVYGGDRQYLGAITDVDTDRDLAAVRITQNEAVALPGESLIDDGPRVFAPSITRAELLALPRIPESELQR